MSNIMPNIVSNINQSTPAPRALFLGMRGGFSPPPLLALLESGIDVCAVVLPSREKSPDQPAVRSLEPATKSRSLLPVVNSSLHTSIERIAWERDIPVWEVSHMSDPETIKLFSHYRPDIICVACFSLYIPRVILALPRLGCLNVHPSLLPANRGPDPLFWTFHEGSHETGVTIHMMDEGMDTGPIVAQQRIEVLDGVTYAQLEALCAATGGKLLASSTWQLHQQLHQEAATLTPQDESQSNYRPLPTADDYIVPAAEWDARRVYNFVRGIASPGVPITILSGERSFQVTNVLSYSHLATENTAIVMGEYTETTFNVRCKDGWVSFL